MDRFHARQHLSDVAKAIWEPGSETGEPGARGGARRTGCGDIDAVLRALAVHANAVDDARQSSSIWRTNRGWMRYAAFHAQGLCTSTGGVEAGCK